jgi:hypothetical protein
MIFGPKMKAAIRTEWGDGIFRRREIRELEDR